MVRVACRQPCHLQIPCSRGAVQLYSTPFRCHMVHNAQRDCQQRHCQKNCPSEPRSIRRPAMNLRRLSTCGMMDPKIGQ